MNTPLNTILNWFQTGDFPTEAQFTASWSSFRHKDDAIPADQISGLSNLFQQTASIGAFNTHLTDSNAHAGYLAKLDATNLTATNVNEWRNKLGVGQLSQNVASVDDADHVGNVYTKNQSNDLFMANADFVNDDGKILAEKIESGVVRKLQGDFKALINTSEAAPDATFTRFVTLKPDGTPGIKNLSDIAGTDTLQNIVDRGNSTTKSIVFNPAQGRAGELNFNAVTQSYHFGNMNSAHTGELNSSYGYNALSKVSSGSENTAYGSYTGANLSTGKENTFFGTYAGENATTGNYNTMVGAESGNSTTTGYKNSFFGTFAGFHNTAGAYNTVMGYAAGNNSVLNDKNTLIGAYAGTGISGYNNVMIGVGSGLNNGNISNKLIIHNNHTHYNYSNTSEGNYTTPQHGQLNRALITGDFVDRWVRFNAGYFQVGNPGNNSNDITINPSTGITAAVQYTPQTNRDFVQRGWIFDNYYNMTQVDSLISRTYRVMGSLDNYAALTSLTNQKVGDVWNILDTGDNYVWVDNLNGRNSPGWDKLSGVVDLSNYISQNFTSIEVNPQGSFIHKAPGDSMNIESTFHINDDEGFVFLSKTNEGNDYSAFEVSPSRFSFVAGKDNVSNNFRFDFNRGLVADSDYSSVAEDLDYVQKSYVENRIISLDLNAILQQGGSASVPSVAIYSGDNIKTSSFEMNPDYINIGYSNDGSPANITVGRDGIQVSDDIAKRGLTANSDYSSNIQDLDYTQKKYVDDNFIKTTGTENPQYFGSSFEFNKGLGLDSGPGYGYGQVHLRTYTTGDHLDFPNFTTQIYMNVEEGIQLMKSEEGGDIYSRLGINTWGMSLYIQPTSDFLNSKEYNFNFDGIYSVYKAPTSNGHFVQKKYVDDKKPYKSYTCILAAAGSPTPSPSFLVTENSVGNIVWTRTGVGEFTGRLNGAFPADKFVCFSQLSLDNGGSGSMKTIIAGRTDNNNIFVKIKNANDGTPYEPNGKFGFLEIRVYN
ncbi:hypothetical protein [uncultured Chryseobacterium sp.]|uniref:hypothetical protein n=1 Tax=uncultured Chryseobacterium sp. TaxID=259322 RepID=UPI0025E64C1B|nr:hypothetical protein [uncultured Chryseobacterium sp.]